MKTFKMFRLLSLIVLCTVLVPASALLASDVAETSNVVSAAKALTVPAIVNNTIAPAAIELMSTTSLTPSIKTASTSIAKLGETVVYTVSVRNTEGPIDVTALMTDTLPQGLQYVPGSLSASSPHSATNGIVDDSHAPALYWTGVLTPDAEIDITYSAILTNVVNNTTIILPPRLINEATITAGESTVTLSVMIQTGSSNIYLPLVMRGL